MTARKPARAGALTQRCGGVFTPDPDVPADQGGRQACRCGLLGEPDDAHHRLPDVPHQEEHRRRVGERGDA
jgi:hypothetical protein